MTERMVAQESMDYLYAEMVAQTVSPADLSHVVRARPTMCRIITDPAVDAR